MLHGEIVQDEYVCFITCLDSFGVEEGGGTVVCVATFIPRELRLRRKVAYSFVIYFSSSLVF